MADYTESIPYFDNGDSITGYASANIEGGRFLMISGPTVNGLVSVAHCDGTKPAIGVSAHSADSGNTVGIHRAREILAPVTTGAALTAGQPVKSDANGQAIVGTPGTDLIQGIAFDDAASGAMAPIDREAAWLV